MDELEKREQTALEPSTSRQETILSFAPRWLSLLAGTALLGSAVVEVLTTHTATPSSEIIIGMAIGLFIYASTGKHHGKS
jgi:hypothetical protein